MPTRELLSPVQRTQFLNVPAEMSEQTLVRYYTLSDDDRIRKGTVTASLILGKLAAYPRQNGLAYALREVGRIEKSLFALEWLQSPGLRRRVQVGLNKEKHVMVLHEPSV